MEQNPKSAYDFYQKGCDAGFMRSCHHLALLTGSGKISHKRDFPKAVEIFNKACDGGDANSCFQLSSIYIQGKEGVPKDMTKASIYSEKACGMGVMYACQNLSRMYTKGEGVEQCEEKAKLYKSRATAIEKQVKETKETLTFTG